MVDFYQALIHYDQLEFHEAREKCMAAREFFAAVPWASRLALCDLLLAQLDQWQGQKRSCQ